jgi:hypothetical protein
MTRQSSVAAARNVEKSTVPVFCRFWARRVLNSTSIPRRSSFDGWVRQRQREDLHSYEVLKELLRSAGSGSSNLPPELKLIMIMTSAMFHFCLLMFT